MKFIIEPINDTDCRITDIDCSDQKALDELVFPTTVEQDGKVYQVKEVMRNAFVSNRHSEDTAKFEVLRHVKKLVISEGIESVDSAGYDQDERVDAEALSEVALPSTLKKIGVSAFSKLNLLTAVNLHDGIEEIGSKAFAGCESLPLFQWPKSLKKISLDAFDDMISPKDENGDFTFVLDIPDSIEVIDGIFSCGFIAECHVSAKAWPVFDSSELPKNIIRIDIPEGVTKVTGKYGWNLTHVTLPSTLTEIGKEVFSGCNLESFPELPESIRVIGDSAFAGALSYKCKVNETEVRIPSPDVRIGKEAFKIDNLRLVGDDTTMKSLMSQPAALAGTLNREDIESIDTIMDGAEIFIAGFHKLKHINIPPTATSITEISVCPALEELVIPDSVKCIGEISSNKSLVRLQLPSGLEKLGYIYYCPEIKELVLADTLKSIGRDFGYKGIRSIRAEIKASPEVWNLICSVEEGLNNYCPWSGELVLPEGVKVIADELLRDSSIKAIHIPASVEEIGKLAFVNCSKLSSLVIAPDSQLKKIGESAFNGTSVDFKELILPNGFTTLGGTVFNDMPSLESVTFPASMADYGFRKDYYGYVTPFVKCKNLKKAIFLADNPETAVYPVALGKMCDWYVPDHMVDHVKAFIEKAKAEYPDLMGVGAKSVKPLSKLNGEAAPVRKKAAPVKKKQALTQPITLEAYGMTALYRFAVPESDMKMLDNRLDMVTLAVRYMRDRLSECSFQILDARTRYSGCVVEEVLLKTTVNGATENRWHSTPKTRISQDFSDTASLPEGFPQTLAEDLAKYGSFNKLFRSKCPNFDKELPSDAPAYLSVGIDISITFDFMIGEKEKFNVKKITVFDDWKHGSITTSCWRFGLMYNGRYIPATSMSIKASRSRENVFVEAFDDDCERVDANSRYKIDVPVCEIEGVKFTPQPTSESLGLTDPIPFCDNIISLIK